MKTAISFDEWWEENYMVVSADRTEAEDIYNLGQQSQQAKIDELQARIDGVLKQLDLAYPDSWGYYVDKAINILKGDSHES